MTSEDQEVIISPRDSRFEVVDADSPTPSHIPPTSSSVNLPASQSSPHVHGSSTRSSAPLKIVPRLPLSKILNGSNDLVPSAGAQSYGNSSPSLNPQHTLPPMDPPTGRGNTQIENDVAIPTTVRGKRQGGLKRFRGAEDQEAELERRLREAKETIKAWERWSVTEAASVTALEEEHRKAVQTIEAWERWFLGARQSGMAREEKLREVMEVGNYYQHLVSMLGQPNTEPVLPPPIPQPGNP